MKITLLISAVLLLCCACEPAKPAAPVKQQPTVKKSTQSLRQEVQSAVDYGIGATQLEAKKRAVKKIDQINEKHNKDLEEALK
ncbi:MAG: hypothetical protein WCT05_07775 [Lentisphaeria bacterium]